VSTHYSSTHARGQVLHHPSRQRVSGPRRLLLLRALLALAFVALGVRLFFVQVVDHAHYAAISADQVQVKVTTTALRAGIYDREGQILAVSRPTSRVVADDFQITHPFREAQALSRLVQVPVSRLLHLLTEKNGFVILNGQLNLNAGHEVSSMDFPGIVVQNSSVRTYPNGPIATSVIGGTNAAGAGSAGLEYQYQKLLAGQTGLSREFASSSGVSLPNSSTTVIRKAKPGVGLELTLDT